MVGVFSASLSATLMMRVSASSSAGSAGDYAACRNTTSGLICLIELLSVFPQAAECPALQADQDADTLMKVALRFTKTKPNIVPAEDTQILVLLLNHSLSDCIPAQHKQARQEEDVSTHSLYAHSSYIKGRYLASIACFSHTPLQGVTCLCPR